MNKSIIAAFALASTLLLTTSCDVLNAGQSNTANTLSALNTGGGMLTNLLSNVLSGGSVTERDLVGNWTYDGVKCAFESQNLLAQAGGVAAASAVETKVDEQLKKLRHPQRRDPFQLQGRQNLHRHTRRPQHERNL